MATLRKFFEDRLLDILFVSIVLQLLTTAMGLIAQNHPAVLVLAATVILLLVVAVIAVRDLRRPPVIGQPLPWPDLHCRGMIVTLGLHSHRANSAALKVLQAAKPELVGFIGTQKTKLANVTALVAQSARLIDGTWVEHIVDPNDVTEVRSAVQQLIGWMEGRGIARSEQLIDLTGGTAIVSVGASFAAAATRVDTIYVASDTDDKVNRPIEGTQRVIRIARYGQ